MQDEYQGHLITWGYPLVGEKQDSNVDIIKTVQEQIESYNFSLTTAEKNEIIQECISEFKNLIDRKSNF